ncbi:uncharacterized protein KRP23_15127 [Phytophthora ramorum]|uniref:uncharacterized protein n=1 Tax=Phytophthora ramorum TaxID=164328 RepID=UPI0030B24F69|nr:hypothetical protein KRP23_15127 [Phytophthora ramorum]
MAAGCSGCLGPVKICMVKYEMLGHDAIMSATTFKDFAERKADESLYDFSVLTPDNLAVGAQLDANGATCQSGVNEFGAMTIAVASSAADILALVKSMDLSIAPQMIREIEIAVEGNAPCESGWNIHGVSRLYMYPTVKGSANFARIPAMYVNLWPDYTECRPDVPMSDSLVGAKLALATDNEDLLSYPTSSSCSRTTSIVVYLLSFGGCLPDQRNTDSPPCCRVSCGRTTAAAASERSTRRVSTLRTWGVCIRNYYTSLWEWRPYVAPENPTRLAMFLNTFRSRYADKVALSVLQGVVVMQMLFMGMISLYQVMSHTR